jgi:hypothetical protein
MLIGGEVTDGSRSLVDHVEGAPDSSSRQLRHDSGRLVE